MNVFNRAEAFSRGALLYGEDALSILEKSKVLLFGLGAVGGFALEALARMGVGNFILVDFDVVDISNINRQLCAGVSTVGKRKTEVWKTRVSEINPMAKIEIFDTFADSGNISDFLDLNPDVIVDAIDTISSKALIICEAWRRNTAVVSSMGAARRKDPLKIAVADIFKTSGCPLAARLRKELKSSDLKGKCPSVFSTEQIFSESHLKSGGENTKKIIGSSPLVTGVFGLNLANLALKEILNKKEDVYIR